MSRAVAVVVVCLALAGCGRLIAARYGIPVVSPSDRQAVVAHTAIKPDPHEGSTTVEGPTIFHDHTLLGHNYLIRGWINPDKPRIHNHFQIVVAGVFPKRVYLRQAYAYGRALDTVVIDRERLCFDCPTIETVGIGLTEKQMEVHAQKGFAFEVKGRRDKIVMAIPPAYFAAVLAVHRRHRAEAFS